MSNATVYLITTNVPQPGFPEWFTPRLYWRVANHPTEGISGWVNSQALATKLRGLDELNEAVDRMPRDAKAICGVRRLRRRDAADAPPVEVSAPPAPLVPTLDLLALSRGGEVTTASARIPPGLEVKVGDRVSVGGHTLTVTEISGLSSQSRIAQCSSHPTP